MARSIYIHLPFCKTKCPYCDFASFAGHDDFSSYIQALLNEIDFRLQYLNDLEKPIIETIFFGGGTPSLHSSEEMQKILTCLKKYFDFSGDIEITLEANPGTIDESKLFEFKALGINRISFGAQSFDPVLLEKLGRGHDVEDSFKTIESILQVGFKSWSFDLIYGLSGQSLDSWLATLDQALSFSPPHISAYALSIEKNTPYGKIFGDSSHPSLPAEDELLKMYEQANEKFMLNQLQRYEISNWSLAGHQARHNLCYWRAQEYYAFGLSAHGFINSKRYQNTRDLAVYLETFSNLGSLLETHDFNFDFCQQVDLISDREKLEERIILKLRLAEGLEVDDDIDALLDKKKIEILADQGYINFSESKITLNDSAMMVSNEVINSLLQG